VAAAWRLVAPSAAGGVVAPSPKLAAYYFNGINGYCCLNVVANILHIFSRNCVA